MRYREVGNTGVKVSEIGFGAEWVNPTDLDSARALVERCEEYGINIVDCWMSDPEVRSTLGTALAPYRDHWAIQGHLGSTWQNGQYVRTRDMTQVRPAFEDLLTRLRTDHIEFGMLHFVDDADDFDSLETSGLLDYAQQLKASGVIGHLGLSTHNPAMAQRAAESGYIEMIMFSCNPAFDLQPADVKLDDFFDGTAFANAALSNISADRERLYSTCVERGVGMTVMKPYAGGRLLNAQDSPFGVALTPVQCLHYALTRPPVASVMAGYSALEHIDQAAAYETATQEELDYASVLADAPRCAYSGQCTYCGHCAPCPEHIDVALVNKYADLAAMHETVPASLADHYRLLTAHASDCIACHQCETRCPFNVPVATRMSQIALQFGY